MKKIIDFLRNMLLAFVYPNRILNLFRVKNLDQNSNRLLGNDNFVKIFAFILALVLVVVSRYIPAPTTINTVTVYNVPLIPVLDEGYTRLGATIPSHISVILSGNQTELDLFEASGGHGTIRTYIDLDGLDLDVEYNNVLIRVEGAEEFSPTATPSALSGIRIVENKEREFPVILATINGGVFEELNEPSSRYRFRKGLDEEYTNVTIRGPEELLDEIVEVRAMFNAVYVDNSVGEKRYEARLVASNVSSEPINDVEIDPGFVHVWVEIFEDLKTIKIELDEALLNVPLNRYETINVMANMGEIQVWGDFLEMDSTYPLPRINFRELDEEGQITFRINLPSNVFTEIDGETVTYFDVVVTVEFIELPPTEPTEDDDDEEENGDSAIWLYEKDKKRKII